MNVARSIDGRMIVDATERNWESQPRHLVAVIALSLATTSLTATLARAQWPPVIDLSQAPPDVMILGAAAYDRTAAAFACGDFDRDGRNDIVVLSEGQAGDFGFAFFYIIWGDSPVEGTLDLANNTAHISIVRAADAEVGTYSHVTAGDFNNDGFDDIVLSIPCRYPFTNCDGKIYIIYGTGTFPSTVDLASPAIPITTIHGLANLDGALGLMMATGNLNGDSFDDLVVSAPELQSGGHVYVFLGRSSMPANVWVASPPPGVMYLIEPRPSVNSGLGLATGDINNDGFDELVVGSPDAAEVMVVYGAAALPGGLLLTDPSVTRITGGAGWNVTLGDFNGDLYADIITSAWWSPEPPGCESCGGVNIIYGDQDLPSAIDVSANIVPITRMFGTGISQLFGYQLTTGDLNSDGYADLLVASQPDEYDASDVGKVTIVFGSVDPPDTLFLGTATSVTRVYAETRPDYFGAALCACDIGSGGASDALIGAKWATALGRVGGGKAYVLFGTPDVTDADVTSGMLTRLGQNYPNPFNPSTFIPVFLPNVEQISLSVFNVQGRRIQTLVNKRLDAGRHLIPWNGLDHEGNPVTSGVYFYRLTGASYSETRKMVLLR